MRAVPLVAFIALCAASAGCPTAKALSGDEAPAPDDGFLFCHEDSDCIAVGASCCECPTFALSRTDPLANACDGVGCPPSNGMCPDNVVPRCTADHKCDLQCKPLACASDCPTGYTTDPSNGCLTCACAEPMGGGCLRDADCVETRADCCGCEKGGNDVAVLKSDQPIFDAGLNCPAMPSCPGVPNCTAGAVPRCLQSKCQLVVDMPPPDGLCGRPDLPKCPGGEACTVNADPEASLLGLGVCAPAP